MRRSVVLLGMVAFLSMGAGSTIQCNIPDFLIVTPPLQVVTIQYVNDADADIDVRLLYMAEDDEEKDDLQEDGHAVDTLVAEGEIQQVVLDCDEAGSLAVDRAKLLLLGDIGPTDGTEALNMGDDYDCGDVITFTYYNSPDLMVLHTGIDVD